MCYFAFGILDTIKDVIITEKALHNYTGIGIVKLPSVSFSVTEKLPAWDGCSDIRARCC